MNFVNKLRKGERYIYRSGNDSVLLQVLEDIDISPEPGRITSVRCKAIQNFPGYQWNLVVNFWPLGGEYFKKYTYLEGQDCPE